MLFTRTPKFFMCFLFVRISDQTRWQPSSVLAEGRHLQHPYVHLRDLCQRSDPKFRKPPAARGKLGARTSAEHEAATRKILYIYIYIYVSLSLSLHIYIYTYIHLSLSLYIYIYITPAQRFGGLAAATAGATVYLLESCEGIGPAACAEGPNSSTLSGLIRWRSRYRDQFAAVIILLQHSSMLPYYENKP